MAIVLKCFKIYVTVGDWSPSENLFLLVLFFRFRFDLFLDI